MNSITVAVGEADLEFNVSADDFNRYINEQMPNDKVIPAFNFLSRCAADKAAFKSVALVNDQPNGVIVMQIAGLVAAEFGGGVSVSLKKPNPSPTA